MNHGTKIIIACGVLCGVIFIASIAVSFMVHRANLEHHRKQFAALCLFAQTGGDWRTVRPQLEKDGFELTLLREDAGVTAFSCGWRPLNRSKDLQNMRLGVPTGAVIEVGPDGRIRSVEGVEAELCTSPSKD